MPIEDTVKDLRRLKAQRSREREIRDFQERVLLDNLDDADRELKGSPRPAIQRKQMHLSTHRAIRDMQIKYERERERQFFGEPKKDYGRHRKPDYPRYNPNADPKVQQLAETHGRHMEHLQNRNRDLERQREEIRRRLDELGRRPIKDDDSMNALLRELKDQEARNQRMLEELRRLFASQNIPMPVPEGKKSNFVYPVYYGNSLVAEIIAVRQAYLQNGGNDPAILQQLAQMLAEAQAIDESLRNRPADKPKDKHNPNSNLWTLELENERLHRQLLLLQEQNVHARNRRKDDREGRARVISYSSKNRSSTVYTQMPPLDVSWIYGRRRRPKALGKYILREQWVTEMDKFKEKIDDDVQNKYGYDFGGKRFDPVLLVAPVPPPKPRSNVGIKSLIPEERERKTKFQLKTEEISQSIDQNQTEPVQRNSEEFGRVTPYFKNHLTSRKLNQADKDLRDSYSRMSQPNLKTEEIGQIDKERQRDDELKLPSLIIDDPQNDADAKVISEPKVRTPTKFETEYFMDTARSEEKNGPGFHTQRAHRQPAARPQLLIENDTNAKK